MPAPPPTSTVSWPVRTLSRLRDAVDSIASNSPSRLFLSALFLVILLFTGLLSLPASSSRNIVTPIHDALFTAASAVTVTGLTTVNSGEHWSQFGLSVIMVAMFVGGLGVITLASILALAVSRRLGLRGKLLTQQAMAAESSGRLGEVGTLLRIIITTTTVIQLALAVLLIPAFYFDDHDLGEALFHGSFYAVSSFNNGGFVSHPDGLAGYESNPFVVVPVMVGVFVGSLGFPVLMVLLSLRHRFSKWSLHAKLTVVVSLLLTLVGAVVLGGLEWNNKATMADLGFWDKVLHSFFASVNTRSGGFTLIDQNEMHASTMLITDALMFAGGGSVSTAGGIKVTTIAVLFLAMAAEARGDSDIRTFGRRIPDGAMRVALSVVVLGATLVALGCALLLWLTDEPLDRVLFESISAFATCGLSVGLSAELPPAGKYVLVALMFAGRVGTITLAAALSTRQREMRFHYPEERPIIG
ncbi:TrkH family potassium uptake protein [Zhihengliuella salsuginis]|uniref:Potassium transporter Trk n=1 Tax=Zhihengliuella salsuginis TaxID=578222 RepID=A0ABQ3GEY0_9MICC|nr:potassium transporter TrkG [Zhihengliuella salsuginis]GHD02993.1 potassium transporter Trk [Zhihengliuella salsuginis]